MQQKTKLHTALGSESRNRLECLIVGAVYKCQREGNESCPFKDLTGLPLAVRAKRVLAMSDDELIRAVEAHDRCPCTEPRSKGRLLNHANNRPQCGPN